MSGYCETCGNTLCICTVINERKQQKIENPERLQKIKEKTQGVNVYKLETGDLQFLIEKLEEEWE